LASLQLGRLEDRVLPTISALVLPAGGVQVSALGGAGDDSFTIRRDASGATVSFYENDPACTEAPACTVAAATLRQILVAGGGGSDLLVIDFAVGNPIPVGGLAYDGGSGPGIDTLEVHGGSCDVGAYTPTGRDSGILTYIGGSIGAATISFTGLEPMVDTIAETTFTISATNAAETITLDNGTATGDGRIRVSSPSFESIEFSNKTNVIINGGTTTADVSDTFNLINTEASTGLATVTVNTGPGAGGSSAADTVFVRSTPAGITTTINGDGGGDLIRVASLTDTLDAILGAVTVNGGGSSDSFQIGDQNSAGPTAGFNYAITSTTVSRTGSATVTYGGIELFLLDARNATPPAGNSISISAGPAIAYTINAGTGNDTVSVLLGGAVGLTINGQAGADTLVGPNAPAAWNLTGVNQGNITGVITSYLNFENLTGGTGADTFAFQTAGSVTGTIDGGAGADTLDYGVFTTTVRANLGITITSAAALDGVQETPPNGSTASGTSNLTYNALTGTFDITMTVTGASATDPNLRFHLHRAPPGVAGAIIVTLFEAPTGFNAGTLTPIPNGFTFTATGVALPPGSEAALLGDVMYLNVHTTAFPGGEIRGQVVRQTQTSLATGVATGAGSVANVENVNGGTGEDSIVGSFAVNSLVGGGGNDTVLGGPGNDQLLGGANDDFLVWSNGDGTDLIEGGAGNDSTLVNGAVGTTGDQFTVNPNGTRVRFDRVNLGLFSLDIGTVETLTINGNNAGDTMTVNNLAGVADLTAVNLFGNADADTFNVQPSPSVTLNVNGGPPTAAPGDALNVDTAGTTTPTLTANSTPTGFQGGYTFGNRQPVNFQQVESITPIAADLSITKTDSPDPVTAGGNLTYTITVANAGPSDAVTVMLNDSLPTNATFVSLTLPAGWSVTTPPVGSSGVVTASRANLAASAGPQVFTLVVRVNANVPGGTSISNTATIGSAGPDPAPGNNTVIQSTAVQVIADVSVAKLDAPDPVMAGNNLTYTLTVSNAGPSDAQGVTLTDSVPPNTRFVSVQQTAGPAFTLVSPPVGGVGAFSANAATFAAGASATFQFVVRVNADTVNNSTIVNTATVLSSTADANTSNNTATASTIANSVVDLDVTKTGPDVVTAGTNASYTIRVLNVGPSNAQGVTLTDSLPANTTFISFEAPPGWTVATPPPGTAGGVVTATADLPAPGSVGPQFFTLVVRVRSGAAVSNTAQVSSATADSNASNNSATKVTTIRPAPLPIVTGADAGGGPHVKLFDPLTGDLRFSFLAYDAGFTGGVRVAAGDVNGDGIPDIITAAGPGGGPHVKVFSGIDLAVLASFFAYDAAFRGGVFVAAGEMTGDGVADVVTGAGPGGGPHVKAFDGSSLGTIGGPVVARSFFAYDASFAGGVTVAAGDVDNQGHADIITGAGPGGGPHVKVFDGITLAVEASFFAYAPTFRGGVFVAAGDVRAEGHAEIITGAGPGGGPHVRIFDGPTLADEGSFFAYDPTFGGGVRVGVGMHKDNPTLALITSPGPGGTPQVRVFNGTTLALEDSFFAYDPGFVGGVFVG